MEVNRGELVMVVGNVGSGKSSLISAFMGSMARVRLPESPAGTDERVCEAARTLTTSGSCDHAHQVKGTIEVSGSVAYAPQQAWIMNATV